MPLIIAEAGVNHNGSEELAIELVDKAYQSGADIVKFQTFKANKLVTQTAEKASYQKSNTGNSGSQLSMLEKLELSFDSFKRIKQHCDELGIEFLSTAFDSESLNFLVNDIGIKRLKIPSGEINNAPLILEHAATGLDLIVSTGMSTLDDIYNVLAVIAYGLINGNKDPEDIKDFKSAYQSSEGKLLLRKKVTLLHCTTEYPAPLNEINLNAMKLMNEEFHLPIGYSDHSNGILVSIAASSLGANIIEKHFTLDKSMEGPDHKASLNPDELKELVQSIRQVQIALGNKEKTPSKSELKNISIARKSLVALKDIKQGDVFNNENLGCKRPGSGITPLRYWELIGKQAKVDFIAGELIHE